MNPVTSSPPRVRPVFPDYDGQSMADNTLQFEWISTIKWNLEHLFADREDVLVAGDNLIYPDVGDNKLRLAPDVYVAFGRPKGYRGSYKVFDEGGVFPQVVFEIWSPGNSVEGFEGKRRFYEKYGAEELYLVFPEFPVSVQAWVRQDELLVRTAESNGFVSPRLGVRFEFLPRELHVFGPDGRCFKNPAEIAAERDRAEERAAEEARQKEAERQRAEEEKQRAEEEKRRADIEHDRAEKLAAKLRELGIDPDAV